MATRGAASPPPLLSCVFPRPPLKVRGHDIGDATQASTEVEAVPFVGHDQPQRAVRVQHLTDLDEPRHDVGHVLRELAHPVRVVEARDDHRPDLRASNYEGEKRRK